MLKGSKYIPILGAVEIVFAALLIPQRTMKVEFILLSCYFAGAMATELSHGMTPVAPSVLLHNYLDLRGSLCEGILTFMVSRPGSSPGQSH